MGNQTTPKIICWDLDNNLGRFDKLFYEMTEPSYSEGIFELRPGIKEVVKDLAKDHTNVITTSTNYRDYVEEVLKRTGLDEHFSGIYLRDEIRKYPVSGKSYAAVARDYGLTEENVSDNLIAIGDASGDQPNDLENVVLIHNMNGWNYDADIIKQVLDKMRATNPESFNQAFLEMRNLPVSKNAELNELGDLIYRNEVSDRKAIQISENLGIISCYNSIGNRYVEKIINGPVIKVVPASKLKVHQN